MHPSVVDYRHVANVTFDRFRAPSAGVTYGIAEEATTATVRGRGGARVV
jgi:hypothetical protein